VRSGNFVYFDTQTHTIGPEHIMAKRRTAAGFPPIEIEGEHYWMVGWSPTRHFSGSLKADLDSTRWLFRSISGAHACTTAQLAEVSTRQKDIQYSSRTRAGTDSFKVYSGFAGAAADLLDKLPGDLRRSPEAAVLRNVGDRKV